MSNPPPVRPRCPTAAFGVLVRTHVALPFIVPIGAPKTTRLLTWWLHGTYPPGNVLLGRVLSAERSNPPSLTQSLYHMRPFFQPARADPGMLLRKEDVHVDAYPYPPTSEYNIDARKGGVVTKIAVGGSAAGSYFSPGKRHLRNRNDT